MCVCVYVCLCIYIFIEVTLYSCRHLFMFMSFLVGFQNQGGAEPLRRAGDASLPAKLRALPRPAHRCVT